MLCGERVDLYPIWKYEQMSLSFSVEHIARRHAMNRFQIIECLCKMIHLSHIIAICWSWTTMYCSWNTWSWDAPKSTKQVRQFLDMATYYRRFIKDFAKIATDLSKLSKLTSKNVKFHWNNHCQGHFGDLKGALHGSEVMAYPLKDGEFVLNTAIGAVLSQVQNE